MQDADRGLKCSFPTLDQHTPFLEIAFVISVMVYRLEGGRWNAVAEGNSMLLAWEESSQAWKLSLVAEAVFEKLDESLVEVVVEIGRIDSVVPHNSYLQLAV
jgi:hypothetical protein